MTRHRLVLFVLLLTAAAARAELTRVEHWPAGDGACLDTPLRLTFAETPRPTAHGKIEIVRASDGRIVDTIDLAAPEYFDRYGAHGSYALRSLPMRIEGKTAIIRPHSRSLSYGESYSVRVEARAFEDFAGIAEGWTFRTKAALARNPDRLIVAGDGRGDFCTVQGAVDQIEPHRTQPAEIFIRKGTYDGLIRIQREKPRLHLVGEDRKATILAGTNNDKLNPGWIQRAVLGVEADDFVLENLTVQNTTPYKGSQAEAVYVNAERCVLRNADFISFQDTLNLSGRVYVADCYIEGDVDYVWGYGTAVFERCELRTMHDGYIVQARNPASRGGYVFLDCQLTAAPGVKKLWLARIETARFPASHVTFLGCRMGPEVNAAGWQITGDATPTLRFEEFGTRTLDGHQFDLGQRQPGAKQLTLDEAARLSDPGKLLGGSDGWQPTAPR